MALTAWHVGGPSTGWRAGPPSLSHIPYGSVETIWLPFMRLHGQGAPTGAEIAIIPDDTVPESGDYQQAEISDGWAGLLLDGTLPDGRHLVWLRIAAAPELVVRGPWLLTVEGAPPPVPPSGRGRIAARITARIGGSLGA